MLFQLRGLRVIIEGKFADHPSADNVALDDARKRVRSGIAHIAAAAVYPVALRSTPTTKIIALLEKSKLRYRIVAETRETETWFEGTPAALMDALRRSQEALTKDDIVEQTAKSLSMQLETVLPLDRSTRRLRPPFTDSAHRTAEGRDHRKGERSLTRGKISWDRAVPGKCKR